jgi:hypothetical protein
MTGRGFFTDPRVYYSSTFCFRATGLFPSELIWNNVSYAQKVGLLGRGISPVARPLPAHRTTQTQKKRIQTSVPPVGFEHTIQLFERAKIVHALDGAATVIGPDLPKKHILA